MRVADVTALAVSPTGTYVAVAVNIGTVWGSKYSSWSSSTVQVWDISKRRKVAVLRDHQRGQVNTPAKILSLAFHPRGQILASGAEDATVRLLMLPSGRRLAALNHEGRSPHTMAFTPDGSQLITANRHAVRVWALDSLRARVVASVECCFESMALHPGGRLIGTGTWENTVQIWRIQDGRLVRTVGPRVRLRWVTATAFSPDGNALARAVRDQGSETTIEVWNFPTR